MVPIRIDVFAILILLGVVQGLFLSILFFRAGSNKLPNRLLGLLMLTLTAFSLDMFLGYSGYVTRVLHFVDVTETLNFVVAPLTYLFVIASLHNQQKLQRIQFAHFIPALFYAFYFLFFFLQTADYKYNAYIDYSHPHLPYIDAPARWHEDPLSIKKYINELQFVHIAVYLSLSIKSYLTWRKTNQTTPFSSLVVGVLVGTGISAILIIGVHLGFERGLGEYILGCVTALFIYAFSYYVVSTSSIFREPVKADKGKYKKSSLAEERANVALRRLETLMDTERPYMDPSFSLPTLAEKLNLSTHHLSQLLNGHLNKSFYEFAAEYRVKAAKSILKDSDQVPIEQVAEQVGYFSKSSFNTVFKKQTGMTPSQYRKQAVESL